MASCTLIYRAGLFLVMVLSLFKPLLAEAHTNSTDVDTIASSTDLSDFTPNVTEGLSGSTDLPSEPGISSITASPSASEADWGDSTATDGTDSFSGFSKNKEPLEEASTATGQSGQSSTFADLESWESPSQTDSTYISTTFTRAGERTLLSVSMNSTSPYTGVTDSSQPAQADTTEVEPSESGEDSSTKQSEFMVTSTGPASRNTSEWLIESTTELSQNETSSGSFPNVTQSSTYTTSVSMANTTLPFTSSSSKNTTTSNTSEQTDAAGTSLSSSTETTSSSSSSSTSGSSTSESLPPSSSGDSVTNGTQFLSDSSAAPVTDTAVVTESSPGSSFTGTEDYTETPLPHTVENSTSLAVTAVPDVQTDTESPLDNSSTELSSSGRTSTNSFSEEPFPTETDSTTETTDILATTLGGITHRTTISDDTTQLTSTASPMTTHPYLPSTTEDSETDRTTPFTTQTTFEPQTTGGASEHLSRTDDTSTDSSTSPSVFYTDGTTLVFETSTATPGKTSENNEPTTITYRTTASSMTTETLPRTTQLTEKATTVVQVTSTKVLVTTTVTPAVSICKQHPCTNNGKCVVENGGRRCHCPPAWQGDDCSEDVDECLSSLCPADSTCVNTRGSFTCECPLGYTLEEGRRCALARTFLGTFLPNNTNIRITETQEIQRELLHMLNTSLSHFRGYYRSTFTIARKADWLNVSAVNLFSIASNVTSQEVLASVQQYMRKWSPMNEHSDLLHSLAYTAVSLCSLKVPRCDLDTSQCSDAYGIAFCQCKPGYFKYNDNDHSCRACDDGHKLENGTCVSCPFGFGGFNCGNPYKLITVVLAAAGGSLLLILGISLIVICCRKDKNDISKLIFKSGEFQMSPYAEHPKSNRISVEWGRETIEMQENGSTKNLLQMTDIYYSPGPRTHEVDRNGLLPYTGLPGSRHSAIIYPGQYNPSFSGDEARRRDYF
ncbi:protein HEG [Acipenser oxyrinchus oxyrinchus]|uniref:Protein HEG n=1 Tax=Acipenser oxyrinchus oxyrinchus TaxID=40147 RepID=A0AAD8DBU8_ACIOX|nr:protein HEG [Acipenser oxyrinchus oxyrinchus]